MVVVGYGHESSNVELALVIKKGVGYISLNDESLLFSVLMKLSDQQYFFEVFEIVDDFNAVASIGVFARLDDEDGTGEV